MNSKHKNKILLLAFFILGITAIVILVLYALQQNINLFFTPDELVRAKISNTVKVRLGGLVQKGSLQQGADLHTAFTLTDFKQDIVVHYTGILPDLFREGQGVVALGFFNSDATFQAEQILAKHDENYMPPELANKIGQVQDVT